jgi:hypothetical protein
MRNIGFVASLVDLIELLDGVSFISTSTTSSNTSDRVSPHPKTKSINNTSDDTRDRADSGTRKVLSYPKFCANKAYLAHYQVCMVHLARINGDLEDVPDEEEEERDEHGNPKFHPTCLN